MASEAEGTASASPSGQENQKKNIAVLKNRSSGPFGAEQTIYLCGTSHVSKKSCEDVRQLIQAVKPQVVMLELCEERRNILNPVDTSKLQMSTRQHLQLWRAGEEPLLAIVYSWMLSQVAERCEITPGEEFRAALEEAVKIQARVCLGDRRVSVTLARSWASFGSYWQKTRFICGLMWAGFTTNGKEMDAFLNDLTEDEDVLTEAMKDFSKQYPQLLRPLIEERDEYMVMTLRRLASRAQTVVAVVGAGHLRGIQDKWDAEIDFANLTSMPERKAKNSHAGWAHVILLSAAGTAAVASIVYALKWRKWQ